MTVTLINGCYDVITLMDNLRHWFKFDHLDREDGIALLIGVVPDENSVDALVSDYGSGDMKYALRHGLFRLDGSNILKSSLTEDDLIAETSYFTTSEIEYKFQEALPQLLAFQDKFKILRSYWNSGKHPEVTSPSYFVQWAISKDIPPEWLPEAEKIGLIRRPEKSINGAHASEETPLAIGDRAHHTDELTTLIQAARKFWAGVDRDDRSMHPKKEAVVKWLIEHGFSPTLAVCASTIIRPKWAPIGRSPKE
jgi:hypothetical protein